MDFTIRRATTADAEALAELGRATYCETFVEEFAIPYPAEDLAGFLDAAFASARMRAWIEDPDQALWLAEADGALVGYAGAGPAALPHPEVRPGDGELKSLYVRRSAQGTGLGRRLFDEALGWLERDGQRTLWIGVWSGNLRAQAVYRARGFEKAGEYDYPVGRWRDREFILRRG